MFGVNRHGVAVGDTISGFGCPPETFVFMLSSGSKLKIPEFKEGRFRPRAINDIGEFGGFATFTNDAFVASRIGSYTFYSPPDRKGRLSIYGMDDGRYVAGIYVLGDKWVGFRMRR